MKWFILCIGICLGWMFKGIYTDIQELTCHDFSTKHSIWQGFSSSKNGQVRCFWLEQEYPNRVRQGVPI
jgi:hypothetical protein